MRRRLKIPLIVAAIALSLPLLVLLAANLGAGRRIIETASGGRVVIDGLEGRFPDRLRAHHLTLRDADGVWASAEDLAIDWSPSRLLVGEAAISQLSARHVALTRLPTASPGGGKTGDMALPVRIALDALRIDRLDLAAALATQPASVTLQGQAYLRSLRDLDATVTLQRLDAAGRYSLRATLGPDRLAATLGIDEPAQGLLAELAGLPDLGAITLTASIDGPRRAEQGKLTLEAGALRLDARGNIDLDQRSVDVDITGTAAAMAPSPGLHWAAATLDSHWHGPVERPTVTGHLAIDGLGAAGADLGRIIADLRGEGGKLTIAATLAALRIPGLPSDIVASAPIALEAEATLDRPDRPVTLTLSHPALRLSARASTGDHVAGSATVTLPALSALLRQAGQGSATMTAQFARHDQETSITVDGAAALSGGDGMMTALLGPDGTFSGAATLKGDRVTIDHARIDGAGLRAAIQGIADGDQLDLQADIALPDLARLSPDWSGALSAKATLRGHTDNVAVTAAGQGEIAAPGLTTERLTFSADAGGLPDRPDGKITLQGRFGGAPLHLALRAQQEKGATRLTIDTARWKSAEASGTLTWSGDQRPPLGKMRLHIADLSDFSVFAGGALAGQIDAALDGTQSQARLQLDGDHIAFDGDRLGHLSLAARLDDPLGRPVTDLQMRIDGVERNGVTGMATIEGSGPIQALPLHIGAELRGGFGAATLSADGTALTAMRRLQIATLTAEAGGIPAHLLMPLTLDVSKGIALDHLRLAIDKGELTASGRLMPTLDLQLAVNNMSPASFAPFWPALDADGSLTLTAALQGDVTAPTGRIQVTGRGLRARAMPGHALPSATIDATLDLDSASARLDARLTAGKALSVTLAGTMPQQEGALDLTMNGGLDLAVLDPILAPNGRSLRGRITLVGAAGGSLAAPLLTGKAQLENGSFQDFTQGIHLAALAGVIEADGDRLRVVTMTGKAGSGSLSASGMIRPLEPDMPVDLAITARDAQPIASDLLTATLDADLSLRGALLGALSLDGHVSVLRADINIPDSFPPNIALLQVRRPNAPVAAPATPSAQIGLAMTIDGAERIFVRGHGLDAEMSGQLRLAGDSDSPRVDGAFALRSGTFSLAGQTLNITSGTLTFDGGGPNGGLDPALDFVAQSVSNGITATLTVGGYADKPIIKLSSSPDLPSDEILAHLLFNQSATQLSALQMASIAQGVASLSGVGGGFDPLGLTRRTLGIDRLAVSGSSGNGNSGTTVEAGKYVANGVYIGTKQGLSGGTQAQVQIDLTKHLKLETTVGTGNGTPATGATPDNDPGSSIGLTYQMEY